jgi:hypothetical protein
MNQGTQGYRLIKITVDSRKSHETVPLMNNNNLGQHRVRVPLIVQFSIKKLYKYLPLNVIFKTLRPLIIVFRC